jgi:hypothetical protein
MINEAVILLNNDHEAKKAIPTIPKNDAKYMGSPSILNPQIIDKSTRNSKVYNNPTTFRA